jgi:molybdopterin-guanine dinucleotide biosynthesis protein A
MDSGVIIAGGRSTRFGDTDKTVAEVAGVPMIRRVADRIAGVVDQLVVNCRPEQTDAIQAAMEGYPLDIAYAEDEVPDRGPVAGIYNGLGRASGRYAFILACDMPFVDPALASHLFERAKSHDGAVPRLESGWFQTTQAVYQVEAMHRACETALELENPRILAPLEELDYVVVEESELRTVASLETFENINTREELEAAEQRLESDG